MKIKLLFFYLLSTCTIVAQEDAWVYFNAKPNSATFFENPLQMLSQRSLDRRNNQNIALDLKDVPIYQLYIDQIAAATGITVMAKSRWLNCLHIRGTLSDITALTNFEFVSTVKFANKNLNSSNKLATASKANSLTKNVETETTFNYGNSNNQITMLNGHLLHQQNYTGAGKIIAVLDAGFPTANSTQPFARLRNNNLILGGYNYVSRSANFYSANSHGTLVLSTMGGFVDNQLVGTAPDAQYYLFITENAPTENPIEESLWVEAAEEADRLGVDIINTSMGYFDYDNPNYSHTYTDMTGDKTFISRGANIAFSRGMIVVVSAGNSGGSRNPHIAAPADATNVLTVGSVTSLENTSSFSSIGPNFSGQIKPDVMARGSAATVATVSGTTGSANGTSFSAPIISGMVACLWQALPTKTAAQIMGIIRASADNFNMPNNTRGYGIPDFAAALRSNQPLPSTEKKNLATAYPNPATTTITFQVPTESAILTIYNTVGQTIYNQKTYTPTVNVSVENFSKGIYFYTITNKANQIDGKFLKY